MTFVNSLGPRDPISLPLDTNETASTPVVTPVYEALYSLLQTESAVESSIPPSTMYPGLASDPSNAAYEIPSDEIQSANDALASLFAKYQPSNQTTSSQAQENPIDNPPILSQIDSTAQINSSSHFNPFEYPIISSEYAPSAPSLETENTESPATPSLSLPSAPPLETESTKPAVIRYDEYPRYVYYTECLFKGKTVELKTLPKAVYRDVLRHTTFDPSANSPAEQKVREVYQWQISAINAEFGKTDQTPSDAETLIDAFYSTKDFRAYNKMLCAFIASKNLPDDERFLSRVQALAREAGVVNENFAKEKWRHLGWTQLMVQALQWQEHAPESIVSTF
jgi:hypothetical protein